MYTHLCMHIYLICMVPYNMYVDFGQLFYILIAIEVALRKNM